MKCRVCGVALVNGENCAPSTERHHNYVCRPCSNEIRQRTSSVDSKRQYLKKQLAKLKLEMKNDETS